jgi:membrane protease YdiL (CAAX protease family)
MKKTFYLLFAILLTVSVFASAPVKAQSQPCDGRDPYTPCCPSQPTHTSTALPINSGVAYLFVAGLIVGVAAVRKQNLATVKVKA